MIINGIEFAFDLDVRSDYDKFVKSLTALQNKQSKGKFGLSDMEAFLSGCLKKDTVERLLSDGRVSTMTKVFTEFFSYGIDNLEAVVDTYKAAASTAKQARSKAENIVIMLQEAAEGLPVPESGENGESAETSTIDNDDMESDNE